VFAFNADVYMHYWRRTLASLLSTRTPVVVTMYCEYEGGELSKVLLDDPASYFSESALEEADAYVRNRYRGDADYSLLLTPVARPLAPTRVLWAFERNPSAHLPPVDCLAKPYRHGVRNSFWMAFASAAPVPDVSKVEL